MLICRKDGVLPLVPVNILDVHPVPVNCCCLLPAQSFLVLSPAELMIIFYLLTTVGVMKLALFNEVSLVTFI
jgi:hypothetical protein